MPYRLSHLAEQDLEEIWSYVGVRSLAIEHYVIYYPQEGDDVLIARILHGRRDQIAAWSESS
jgi:plasmid stabilization system protein ParE